MGKFLRPEKTGLKFLTFSFLPDLDPIQVILDPDPGKKYGYGFISLMKNRILEYTMTLHSVHSNYTYPTYLLKFVYKELNSVLSWIIIQRGQERNLAEQVKVVIKGLDNLAVVLAAGQVLLGVAVLKEIPLSLQGHHNVLQVGEGRRPALQPPSPTLNK